MSINIKLLSDRVLVKPAAAEEKTKSGLYIPDTAKEKPMQGEVVAVGTGKVAEDGKVTPCTVQVGDKVLYGKYSGSEMSFDGEDYLMMREADIFGII